MSGTTIIPGSIPATPETKHTTSINNPLKNTDMATEAVVTKPIDEQPTLEASTTTTTEDEQSTTDENTPDDDDNNEKKGQKFDKANAKHKKQIKTLEKELKEEGEEIVEKVENEKKSLKKQFDNTKKKVSKKIHDKDYKDEKKKEVKSFVSTLYSNTLYYAQHFKSISQNLAVNVTKTTTSKFNCFLNELHNPVVSTHFVAGLVLVTSLLNGYAKKNRYLTGKSDSEILMITTGVTALSIADIYMFKKLYPKYKKD